MDAYQDYLAGIIGKENLKDIKASRTRVLLDPNGGAGIIAKDIFNNLGIRNMTINSLPCDYKRKVEPDKKSLDYLKDIAKEKDADFAAGFDCDADRVNMILSDGTFVSGQHILALIVDDMLASAKGKENVVVTNDATSGLVKEVAESYGAKIKEVEVGEINVVDEMERQRSLVGGEGSNGGVIIPPNRCRDGILTVLKILGIIARKKRPLSNIIHDLPRYFTLKKNLKLDTSKIRSIKKNIRKHYEKEDCSILESSDPFGTTKIFLDDAWVFFRASRTEHDTFRVMADANSEKKAKKLLREAVSVLNP